MVGSDTPIKESTDVPGLEAAAEDGLRTHLENERGVLGEQTVASPETQTVVPKSVGARTNGFCRITIGAPATKG